MKAQPIGSTARPDEALAILNMKLSSLVDKYRNIFYSMVTDGKAAGDMNAEVNIAVALYFCTYFHLQNLSCKRYISQVSKNCDKST